MSRAAAVRKVDLDRALKALADAGQCARSIVVKPGEVIITPGLTEPAAGAHGDELTDWRARRAGRSAQGS